MTDSTAHVQHEFSESQRLEAARIAYLVKTRGEETARTFAEQTLRSYRRAVVYRAPPAGDRGFRLRLLAAYCYLKRYLRA